MTKRTLIVANWKMHNNVSQASVLLHRLHERIKIHRDVEIVLAPPTLDLQPLSLQMDRRKFRLAAQNAFHKDEGAFTGEVSFTMLRELVHYVIIGHSERRIHFGEDLEMVRDKVSACVRNEITPILCIGETHIERKNGETKRVLHDQLTTALSNLTEDEVKDIVIAYEPVWAIGAGTPATPDQITEAVACIKNNVSDLYGVKTAEQIRVLYGASVAPDFVADTLSIEGVHGLLVGGASLNYHQFSSIIDRAYLYTKKREE